MSLLNDMLRDLSQQQVPTAGDTSEHASLDPDAQEQRELFSNSSAAKPIPRTLVPSLLAFFFVLAIFAVWQWVAALTPEEIATPATIVGDSETAVAIASAKIMQPVASEITAGSETADKGVVVPELVDRLAALESAITQLSVAVASNNNPPPVSDDARDSSMDLVTNQSVEAEDTVTLAETSVQSSELAVAGAGDVPASVSIRDPFEPAVSATPLKKADATFSIAPNIQWLDQQQAERANALVAEGKTEVAVVALQKFIATADKPLESTKVLLNIFVAQEDAQATRDLLGQANYLPPVEQTFYAAKIAVMQRQEVEAIELLEQNLTAAEQHENYRALLAGLYQRSGMNLEAANHYRRLLSVFGDKPAYWLGFALAQDALNQPVVAAQAYQRLDQYADLQPQVRTYIQQRIAALQQ